MGGVSSFGIEIGSANVIYYDSKLDKTDLEADSVKAGYEIAA